MDDQITEKSNLTRTLTDATLIIVAVAAVAAWLWRRVRRSASVTEISPLAEAQSLDDKVGAALGFPSNIGP